MTPGIALHEMQVAAPWWSPTPPHPQVDGIQRNLIAQRNEASIRRMVEAIRKVDAARANLTLAEAARLEAQDQLKRAQEACTRAMAGF